MTPAAAGVKVGLLHGEDLQGTGSSPEIRTLGTNCSEEDARAFVQSVLNRHNLVFPQVRLPPLSVILLPAEHPESRRAGRQIPIDAKFTGDSTGERRAGECECRMETKLQQENRQLMSVIAEGRVSGLQRAYGTGTAPFRPLLSSRVLPRAETVSFVCGRSASR